MIVRPATPADVAAIAAIYARHVLHGAGTFEETPPSEGEMAARLEAVRARGLPWVVAEEDGAMLAYAYAAPYRLRSAYRYAAEDSVYASPAALRRGAGRAALQRVIAECEAIGLRRLVAMIGDAGNAGSIGLHQALGFTLVGALPGVGYKHGRWLDVVIMHKPLNGGDDGHPVSKGLDL